MRVIQDCTLWFSTSLLGSAKKRAWDQPQNGGRVPAPLILDHARSEDRTSILLVRAFRSTTRRLLSCARGWVGWVFGCGETMPCDGEKVS